MAQCKWCGKSSWLITTNSRGLCNRCAPPIDLAIRSQLRVILESAEIVRKSKKLETRIARSDLVIERLRDLLERYESRGIFVCDPAPSAQLSSWGEYREKALQDGLKEELDALENKLAVATGAKASVTAISKSILAIRELAAKGKNPGPFTDAEQALHRRAGAIQLQEYLDDAEKAELKGNPRRALDRLYEALFLLRREGVGESLRVEYGDRIESKIRALGGEIH